MSLSRRSFLKGTAAAGVAVALGRIPSVASAPPPTLWGLPVVATPTVAEAWVAPFSGVTKMSAWVPMTDEMLADSVGLEGIIRERLVRAFEDDMAAELAS